MIKRINLVFILFSCIMLSSCFDGDRYSQCEDDLIIYKVRLCLNKNLSCYSCRNYSKKDHRYSETIDFIDETGKFNVGDTIKIVKK